MKIQSSFQTKWQHLPVATLVALALSAVSATSLASQPHETAQDQTQAQVTTAPPGPAVGTPKPAPLSIQPPLTVDERQIQADARVRRVAEVQDWFKSAVRKVADVKISIVDAVEGAAMSVFPPASSPAVAAWVTLGAQAARGVVEYAAKGSTQMISDAAASAKKSVGKRNFWY